jgi:hypothetical protein
MCHINIYNNDNYYTIKYYYMQCIFALRLEETGSFNEEGGLSFGLLINETAEKDVQDTSYRRSGSIPQLTFSPIFLRPASVIRAQAGIQ